MKVVNAIAGISLVLCSMTSNAASIDGMNNTGNVEHLYSSEDVAGRVTRERHDDTKKYNNKMAQTDVAPFPASVWLLGSIMLGLAGLKYRGKA